jgi:DNA-binding NarL/FixJ family response regulator
MTPGTDALRRSRVTGLGYAQLTGAPLPLRPPGAPGASRGWPASHSPFAERGRSVTLALIGGQRMLREATASLIGAQDGLRVLGAFESAAQYLLDTAGSQPAVLLLDCDCGFESGQEIAALRSASVDSKVLMLCRQVSEELIHCAIEHRAGGVILKSCCMQELRAAIAYVASGRTVMPSGWQRLVAADPSEHLEASPRQREILSLIAEGRCNQEIAARLELSPNTVKFHIRSLYARLGVRNRVEAANVHAQMTSGGG